MEPILITTDIAKAIGKAIAEQSKSILTNREKEFKVSFNIRGDVNVKKGNDFQQIVNFSIDWQKAFLFALNKLNKDTANTVLKEFLQAPEIEITKEFKTRCDTIIKEIKQASLKTVSGKVTINNPFLSTNEIEVCENC
jgi:hypothetical protein